MKGARKELERIQGQLSDWELDVAQAILEIPSGKLATYGCLARMVAERRGASFGREPSRAVAKLRRKLYGLLTHDTPFPLHRVASKGDLYSKKDTEKTRTYNNRLRDEEGTLREDDPWWCGEGIVD